MCGVEVAEARVAQRSLDVLRVVLVERAATGALSADASGSLAPSNRQVPVYLGIVVRHLSILLGTEPDMTTNKRRLCPLRLHPGFRRADADGHATPAPCRARHRTRDLVRPAADRRGRPGLTREALSHELEGSRSLNADSMRRAARSARGRGADPRRRRARSDTRGGSPLPQPPRLHRRPAADLLEPVRRRGRRNDRAHAAGHRRAGTGRGRRNELSRRARKPAHPRRGIGSSSGTATHCRN